jgi:hypothetical protein
MLSIRRDWGTAPTPTSRARRWGSVEGYKKEGPKFMRRLVAKQKARVKDS